MLTLVYSKPAMQQPRTPTALLSPASPPPTPTARFRFGDWVVEPSLNTITNPHERRQMEPRTMDVLLALCAAGGEIVSSDELLARCWGGVLLGDSPLHKNIAQLRRILGDSASAPAYIETIRKRGYRTVAPLEFFAERAKHPGNWESGSPFRGLLAFDQAHAAVFFGRDDVTRHLGATVLAQARSGLSLTVVLGPSGAGKTSLIQAGLLAGLAPERATGELAVLAATTLDLIDLGQQSLPTSLACALLDLEWDDQLAFPGENAMSLGARLAHDCAGVVAELAAALAPAARLRPGLRFAIFIDRFEALFNTARTDEAARNAFLDMLELLARSPALIVLIACRNDYYPSIARCALLSEARRLGGHFDLDPPGFNDIPQIIRAPAAAARLSFGVDRLTHARLDDVLCESAIASPDALPLLQYCLQELYRLRTDTGELSFDAFRQLGELEGAIGQRAEQVVLGLTPLQRDALPRIMAQVVVLSTDDEQVGSQRAPWTALPDEAARQAVAALIEARLFVSDLVAGTPVFGIAHEAILRRWPRISAWVDTHRGALRARSRLTQHARRWRAEGRPSDLLLPKGTLLAEATLLQQGGVVTLSDTELECIQTSARRVRQRDRLRLSALALIVLLALVASLLGVSALAAKRSAETRREEAEGLIDFMLGDLTDKLRPLGRLDFLDTVSSRALQYLRGTSSNELNPTALTLRAKGLQMIGEVRRSRGDSAGAIDALHQASAILTRQLEQAPRDIQVLNNLGANAYWIGQLHKDRNQWQQAQDAWRDYLRFSNRLYDLEPDNTEWWVERSYAHNNLGNLALMRGQPEQAIPEFLASIALKQRALARKPSSRTVMVELADSYSWLASATQSLGKLQAARQLYAEELQLVLRLADSAPDESLWTHRHAVALQHRALNSMALGLDRDALRDYGQAQRLFARIVERDGKHRGWQAEKANLEQERLWLLARTAPAAEVLSQFAVIRRTWQDMMALDPKNVLWARRAAIAHTHFAAILLKSGQNAAAGQELQAARTTLQPIYDANPDNLSGRLALAETLLLSSSLQQKQGDTKLAISTCQQIRDMLKNEGAAPPNFQVLELWSRVNACLGDRPAVRLAAARLQDIGYADQAYLQFISHHP
ncbi:nSTAND1 domain-containing NTPase [Duganella levis]|uniref:OmpR/PhoB-type domain-containing protein n=1 Tax=Duganella levis TaxID=2692169 RepID=A0ABW9W2N9_9BURK|nr:winged helix-turn-helix domain-containing protein [Duganella levis]MYN27930.1 hypothetical protein [Duganella levis]